MSSKNDKIAEPISALESELPAASVIAAVACDMERAPLGMRSRLDARVLGHTVVWHTVRRLLAVETLDKVVLMVRGVGVGMEDRMGVLKRMGLEEHGENPRVAVMNLVERPEALSRRIEAGRIWGQLSWRGGAGQYSVFDEDYHPASVGQALQAFGDPDKGHVLNVPGHAALLATELVRDLIDHHLHKNHELQFTYTTAAPGLAGMMMQAELVRELGKVMGMPGQLLAYDPQHPVYDTLIRESCMPVDPALSRLHNRFLLDTDRSWQVLVESGDFGRYLELPTIALAEEVNAARGEKNTWPWELEIDVSNRRETQPAGSVPGEVRSGWEPLTAEAWEAWFGGQKLPDDLTITLGASGGGDPLAYGDSVRVLRAARQALRRGLQGENAVGTGRGIHVQTDLLGDPQGLIAAIEEDLVDTISVCFYGDDEATYRQVAWDGKTPPAEFRYGKLWENFELVRAAGQKTGRGVPLLIGRLLKVRATVGQLENFFDKWIMFGGWGVIDYPTDRAGKIPFAGVVDMAPGRKRPCRRIQRGHGRLLILPDGRAVACDQCVCDPGKLVLGRIGEHTLAELWRGEALENLRARQARIQPSGVEVDMTDLPCEKCREWHRA